jgi:tRNA pseudouridine55 synthase
MNGALIVDKPSGPTSHDIVALARRALGESRIGHTGTLDPLATGVLILLVGRATRLSQFLVTDEKEYIADIRLGASTPTYDAQSLETVTVTVLPENETNCECPSFLERALGRFRGTFLQTPPPYSAKKIAGRRAYQHARKQQSVELKPVEVTVSSLDVLSIADGMVRVRIVCSAGFYVRSLAHDLGKALGCGAHLEALRRTRVGRFGLDGALPVELLATRPDATRERLISISELLGHLAAVTVSEEGARRATHGNTLTREHVVADTAAAADGSGHVRLFDGSGLLLAVAERGFDASLHPLTVLV